MTNIYYVDGFTLGSNPSDCGGYTVTDSDGNIVEQHFVKSLGGYSVTNNFTELLGVYKTVLLAPDNSTIYTDSQNTISWIFNKFQKKSKRKDLIPFCLEIRRIVFLKNINIVWQSRWENKAGLIHDDKEPSPQEDTVFLIQEDFILLKDKNEYTEQSLF